MNTPDWPWALKPRLMGLFVRTLKSRRKECHPRPHRMRLRSWGHCRAVSIHVLPRLFGNLTSLHRWHFRNTNRCRGRSNPACTRFQQQCQCIPRRNGRCNYNYNGDVCQLFLRVAFSRCSRALTLPNRRNCCRSCFRRRP